MESLPGPLVLRGATGRLGRRICCAMEVTGTLASLLAGWSCSARGCPKRSGWDPGLWPAQLGIAARLFKLHKHLRSQNAGGSKFRLLGSRLGKQMLRGSRIQVQERLAFPSPCLGSGFPGVQGVWESWKRDDPSYGGGGAVEEDKVGWGTEEGCWIWLLSSHNCAEAEGPFGT